MATTGEMRELLAKYLKAYRKKDPAGCAECYMLDAVVYSPFASPAKGRMAIQELHCEWVADGGDDKMIDIVDAGSDQRSFWCVARFSEGDPPSEGFSLNVFERDVDGTLRIKVSSLSAFDG